MDWRIFFSVNGKKPSFNAKSKCDMSLSKYFYGQESEADGEKNEEKEEKHLVHRHCVPSSFFELRNLTHLYA